MDIVDRTENPLLRRVEIRFQWRHSGDATPSRDALLAAVTTLEPGATRDRIIIKEVSTRFGQPLTTGLALVYEDEAALSVEPAYILARHGMGATEGGEA